MDNAIDSNSDSPFSESDGHALSHRLRPQTANSLRGGLAIPTFIALWCLAFKVFSAEPSTSISVLPLPRLQVNGRPAKAHTQGLELAQGYFYTTARLDDPKPRRALLLRTTKAARHWDVWDITITNVGPSATEAVLDHPGGLQFDGRFLWVPVAESRRGGITMVCAYGVDSLQPGRAATASFKFKVEDHIGALAVSKHKRMILGASWDTETVCVWDLDGNLKRKLDASELKRLGLGIATGPDPRSGVAVQDWKFVDDNLYAAGLFKSWDGMTQLPRSRLMVIERFGDQNVAVQSLPLERYQGVELASEGMAVTERTVWFLPEDLGASNRLFFMRVP